MKNLTLIACALFIGATLTSCDKTKTLKFTMNKNGTELTIPATTAAGTQTKEGLVEGVQKFAKEKNFDVKDIKTIKAKKVTVTIKDTSTVFPHVTYDLITEAYAYARSNDLGLSKFATMPSHAAGATSLDFDVVDTDLTPYLKLDSFYYYTSITTNGPLTHDVVLSTDLTFDITVEVKLNMFGK